MSLLLRLTGHTDLELGLDLQTIEQGLIKALAHVQSLATEGGKRLVQDQQPRSPQDRARIAIFWLWYLSVKIRQFFKARTGAEERALRSLRGFRRKLAHRSQEN